MVTANVLEVVDVSKHFGGVYAVGQVNLRLRRNEILGLVGANGAGKSTLIKMISGSTAPDSGHLKVEDRTVEFRTPMEARNCGIETVYQDLALLKHLDVTANIFMGRELCRRTLAARGRSTFSELRWYPPMEAAKGSLSWVFRAKQPESVRTGP